MAKKKHRIDPQTQVLAEKIWANQVRNKEEKATRDLVSALYCALGLAMHETEGFGEKRIMRVYERLNDYLDGIQEGKEDVKSLREKLRNDTNVILEVYSH